MTEADSQEKSDMVSVRIHQTTFGQLENLVVEVPSSPVRALEDGVNDSQLRRGLETSV